MEAALELDDDLFFADISKQISLLIMDDDDDDAEHSFSHYPSANLQGFSSTFRPPLQASYLAYDHQQAAIRRECKGTGVFIPRSSHHRRRNHNKNRQGKSTGSANKFLRPPSDLSSREFSIPQMNYHNINSNPSYDQSFNLRRF